MILKKVLFPILICMLLFSCDTDILSHEKYDEYTSKGNDLFKKNQFDSAYVYFEKSKSYSSKVNNENTIIYPLLMLSEIQRLKNDYHGCEENLTEALKYVTATTDRSYLIFMYNNFALSYSELADYKEALKYYNLSYKLATTLKAKLIIQNNIAYNYLKQNKFTEAKKVLSAIKDNDSLKNDTITYARVLDNLGYTQFKLNESNGIKNLTEAQRIRKKSKDEIGLTATSMHLAEYYSQSNKDTAKAYAIKALKFASKIKNPDDKIEALQFLTKLSDGKNAKDYALQTFTLTDSLVKARKVAKNQFAKIKYDSKQALNELEKQKRHKEFLILGIISLFGIGLFAYYKIKKRNHKKIRETAYQTETRIAKKLHDELANDVHNTIAFAETQDLLNPKNKDTLLENLETIYNRTRNISNENKDIDTGELYLEKLKALLASYNSADRNVIVNVAAFHQIKTSKEVKIVVYRVLQELMVNMKKHSQCTIASITFTTSNKQLQINYSDNGIGTDNLINLKNGLQNAENRILSINGTLTFDTALNKGFKVKIQIPKP